MKAVSTAVLVIAVLVGTPNTGWAKGPKAKKAEIAGSCENVKGMGSCDEYSASAGKGMLNKAKKTCMLTGGKWSAKPCPKKKMLGGCRKPDGKTLYWYAAGGTTKKMVKTMLKNCSFMGGKPIRP